MISPTAISPFRSGGQSWSSYWSTRLPYFTAPAGGISVMVGQEVTLYGDALLSIPIGGDLTVTYTCDIGTQSGNNLVINPEAGDIGEHGLLIVAVSNGVTRVDEATYLRVRQATTLDAINVLMIGDSLVAGGIVDISTALDTAIVPTVTYLGTQGDTVKHEGHSGWNWSNFVMEGSPFYKDGALNIPAYFADNSIATPDAVLIRLGVNEMFSQSSNTLTETEITTIINAAKTLLTGFLNYNASLKIIIGLPTICENTGAGWNTNYDESVYLQNSYIEHMHRFWDALINEFDNGTYNARVSVSTEAMFLDRDDGYPKTDEVHTNGVHPDASGYTQLGQAMAAYINKEYLFGVELIPTPDFSGTTGYTINAGWEITGGKGVATTVPSGNGVFCLNVCTATKTYRTKYTIDSITAGSVAIRIGAYGTARNAAGTYIENITAITAHAGIYGYAASSSGVIDNLSVKEILAG